MGMASYIVLTLAIGPVEDTSSNDHNLDNRYQRHLCCLFPCLDNLFDHVI